MNISFYRVLSKIVAVGSSDLMSNGYLLDGAYQCKKRKVVYSGKYKTNNNRSGRAVIYNYYHPIKIMGL